MVPLAVLCYWAVGAIPVTSEGAENSCATDPVDASLLQVHRTPNSAKTIRSSPLDAKSLAHRGPFIRGKDRIQIGASQSILIEVYYGKNSSFGEVQEALNSVAEGNVTYFRSMHTAALTVRGQPAIDQLLTYGWRISQDEAVHNLVHERLGDCPTNGEQETPYGITMVNAPEVAAPAVPKKVCVVDTGYTPGHEDLPSGLPSVDGSDVESNGNWDEDGHGHGTHCAGTVRADDNDIGVASVFPTGYLYITKGLSDSGSGSNAGVLEAVQACVDGGADVISLSLGGGGYSSVTDAFYEELYEDHNVLILGAAGNGGSPSYLYPASYKALISVAAVDSNRNRASFSQYNDQVEIAAPGVGVCSTLPTTTSSSGYAAWSGTSMACPHAAGVAGLVWSHFPECTNHQIRAALLNSAADEGDTGCDNLYGHGIVDAEAAFDLLTEKGCDGMDDLIVDSVIGGCAQTVIPVPTPPPTPCASGMTVEVEILTDNYPSETYWYLEDAQGEVVEASEGAYGSSGTLYEHEVCCVPGPHVFRIEDTYGDGICCGYGQGEYKVFVNGVEVVSGGEFGETEEHDVPAPDDAPPTPTPPPEAPPTPTPAPDAPPTPTPAPEAPTPSPGCDKPWSLLLLTDHYGCQTTWEIEDATGNVLQAGSGYASDSEYSVEGCLDQADYAFTIFDSQGDGICCGWGHGDFTFSVSGVPVLDGGDFTDSKTVAF